MQKMNLLLFSLLFTGVSYAGETTLKLGYENFDFENSKKKDRGQRYITAVDHKEGADLYQVMYERTDTRTFKPPLTEDLKVDKVYFKYTRRLDDAQAFNASFTTINDNIMEETDDGRVYGLGYQYKAFGVTQYMTDYPHFDVYQTDAKYTFKKEYMGAMVSATVLGKYIHLQNKNSNLFSQNAQTDYFTPGFKLHAHHHGYHVGVGAFLGKRIFAVMNDGFRVQHHAMEFDRTYMAGITKDFDDLSVQFRYIYQRATEIPINNANVKVNNFSLLLNYTF